MITTVIIDNVEHTIVTQQYQCGLYVIEDSDPAKQYGVDAEEVEFHTAIRKEYKYNPDKSSVL